MAAEKWHVRPDDVETMVFDWGSIKITSAPAVTGAAQTSVGLVVMDPGAGHGRHSHPGAEEIIYVLSGSGEQMVEDEHGNAVVFQVTPGSTIFVPESRGHYTINTGWEPMKVFVVYAPAGAEADLRKQPGFRAVPAGQAPRR